MKNVTTSLILACMNLLLIAMGFLDNWKHFLPLQLPHAIAMWPGVIALAVIPFLALITVGFALRDLVRPGHRLQGVLAVLLSAPVAVIYYSTARL